MNELSRATLIRIGVFLILTIATLCVAIFTIGRSESLFSRTVTLSASFVNASGLVAGAPVRLGGVDIGTVRSIRFSDDPTDKKIDVALSVRAKYLPRIRRDSVAQMTSKGLLGDALIDITVGSAGEPELKDGDRLETQEVTGLNQVVGAVETTIQRVDELTGSVDARLEAVLTDQLAKDVGRIAHSTAAVMEMIERGPGIAHRLIADKQLAEDTAAVLRETRQLAMKTNHAVGELDRLVTDAQRGRGLVHALVYDERGSEAVARLANTSRELEDIVSEVKNGRGILHALVYDEDATELLRDLNAASRVLAKIAAEVEAGKGTVGGLIKDPTAYQDLTTILGNLKRNALLKALVRFTIESDGLERPSATGQEAAAAK